MTCKAIHNPRYRSLVAFISDTRKRQGLTQSELGQQMRLSRQTIQKIESCEVRLDLVRYVALCRILGLKAGPLLGRLEEPSDEDDPLTYQRPLAFSRWPFLASAIHVEIS
jgi:transcriptional regulator with XRE-family HTH domain